MRGRTIGTDVDKNTERIPRMIMTMIGYAMDRRWANEWKGSRKLNQRGFERNVGANFNEQINQYLDNKKHRRNEQMVRRAKVEGESSKRSNSLSRVSSSVMIIYISNRDAPIRCPAVRASACPKPHSLQPR